MEVYDILGCIIGIAIISIITFILLGIFTD